ncbi:MAG: hypothetical protein HC827_16950 [Cyanobacteria bacterium RM1_2_2]|nr:hypothetical protein [Cyanobacteria bacterium RM1_2_2]
MISAKRLNRWGQQQWLGNGLAHRHRSRSLCRSEIMTILIGFHPSAYRNCKADYIQKVQTQWHSACPRWVNDGCFVESIPSTLALLVCLSPISITAHPSQNCEAGCEGGSWSGQ